MPLCGEQSSASPLFCETGSVGLGPLPQKATVCFYCCLFSLICLVQTFQGGSKLRQALGKNGSFSTPILGAHEASAVLSSHT